MVKVGLKHGLANSPGIVLSYWNGFWPPVVSLVISALILTCYVGCY